jgi:hypothetical protein
MDDFRVGGMPTPPLDAGFSPEDTARTTGSAPIRRTGMSGGLANAAMTDHVGGNDPAGPNLADWLDAPGPGQDIDMTALMVTLHQAAVTLRTAMHEAQQVARDAQEADMRSEANDIRNSAGLSFTAAVVAGACQIAGGALDIAGSFHAYSTAFPEGESQPATEDTDPTEDGQGEVSKTLNSKLKSDTEIEMKQMDEETEETQEEGANALKKQINSDQNEAAKSSGKPEEKTPEQSWEEAERKDKEFQLRMKKADFISQGYSGLSKAVGGMGQIVSGGYEMASHQQDAAEKEHEADAMKAASQVEDADNLLKNIDDLISGVRQAFSQMIEAKNEAMNRITQL